MTTAYGNIASFTAPGSSTTSASQFNQTAVNAAVQSSCAAGFTCSAVSLYEIDFTLTANLSSTVTVNNSTASTQYVGAISGQGGTYVGGATSGIAVASVATLTLSDPLNNDLVDVLPTFSIATDTRRKIACGSGTPTSGNYSNCLSIGSGSHMFSGTGTDTKSGSLTSGDLDPTTLAAYVGSGNVTFDLALGGQTNNGSLPSAVTIPGNTATIQALTNGLKVEYLYSYEQTAISSSPEPTTMALFGGALLGLGFFGRKRRTNSL